MMNRNPARILVDNTNKLFLPYVTWHKFEKFQDLEAFPQTMYADSTEFSNLESIGGGLLVM